MIFPLFLLALVGSSQASGDGDNAGIFIRLNQKAVDYMADLASEMFPKILHNLSPPNLTVSPAFIYNTVIQNIAKPNISAKFIKDKGIKALVSFPDLKVASNAKIDIFIISAEGAFLVNIQDLLIDMEIHYSRNETTKRNKITYDHCNVTHSTIGFVFDKDSDLNGFRTEFEDGIMSGLRSAVCEASLEALQFIDEQDIQAAALKATEAPVPAGPHDFSLVELGASLCQNDQMVPEQLEEEVVVTYSNGTEDVWAPDLTIVYPPKFTDDDLVFGVDGGILLNGKHAEEIDKPNMLNASLLNSKMVGIMISDYIPNTLFSHVFDSGLARFHERFLPTDLPKFLRKLGKMVCDKCHLDVYAVLNKKPVVEVSGKYGARVLISANITVTFQGRTEKYSLLHANTVLHVTLKPTIRHSRFYGDVSLTNVDVNIFDMTLGGLLAGPLEKMTSLIVPKILWPEVKKRLRFALNKRGVQLPIFCGVELEHLSLSYVDHGVFLNTDFKFDWGLFVQKFQIYLTYKASHNPDLPRYIF